MTACPVSRSSQSVSVCRRCERLITDSSRVHVRGRLVYHMECAPRCDAPHRIWETLKCFALWLRQSFS